MNDLHVFADEDRSCFIVAHSADEALEVFRKTAGYGHDEDLSEYVFGQCSDDESMTIHLDDEPFIGPPPRFTFRQWIERELPKHDGKPFDLCWTEM